MSGLCPLGMPLAQNRDFARFRRCCDIEILTRLTKKYFTPESA